MSPEGMFVAGYSEVKMSLGMAKRTAKGFSAEVKKYVLCKEKYNMVT